MDFQTIAAIIFLFLLTLFLISKRKKISLQKILFPFLYFAMYRTKFGLKFMDRISRYKKTLKILGFVGIVIGYLGIILISFALLKSIYDVFTKTNAASGVALVLPFPVKGAFYVPFFYWIISIFIIALIHEFSHGVIARAYNIKIKSSGFAFLGVIIPIIPAAFVEPDEKVLKKRPYKQQLSVFAAGPFSNIFLAIIVLVLFIGLINPISSDIMVPEGVKVTGFIQGVDSASETGLSSGEIIKEIDDKKIKTTQNISDALDEKSPGEKISITTDKSTYDIELSENPENKTEPYLGIYLKPETGIKKDVLDKYGFLATAFVWITGLLFWLYVLNLGIGLFNLVPLGPIDGGRMLQVTLYKFIKDKKKADIIWKRIGLFFLALILVSILFSFFA